MEKNRLKRFLSLTGFTLIELLIAILIFSIIVTVIYSTFYTGTSVWKRTKAATEISMNIDSILEDLSRNLRSAVKYNGLEFKGELNKLEFCYLSDTVTEDAQYREIYRSSYYSKAGSIPEKFDLFQRKSPLIKGGFNIDEVAEEKLIDSLDDFKIEYAYKDETEAVVWKEKWENPIDIPKAIKINIKKEGVNLNKYISIPSGKLIALAAE